MKKFFLICLFLVAPLGFADENSSSAAADCRAAAEEANVPAEEMDAYIQSCIAETAGSSSTSE